jgi:tRNA pseudouridine55 synthase
METDQMLLVDKPKGWTSFDVVSKIRSELKKATGNKKIKVGHSGTLDPQATGLLILCTGSWTKKLNDLLGLDKEYSGIICLGATTPTLDAEGEISEVFPYQHITALMIEEKAKEFIGEIQQIPPMFSAIKVNGQPLYKKARKGEEIEIPARKIIIYAFEITDIQLPHVQFYVKCSKGTYIRSLARDFGKSLGSGAYLKELKRISIGNFHLKNAKDLDTLVEQIREYEKD